jgi:hypothetical protein
MLNWLAEWMLSPVRVLLSGLVSAEVDPATLLRVKGAYSCSIWVGVFSNIESSIWSYLISF